MVAASSGDAFAHTADLAALARGVGLAGPVDLFPTARTQHPSKHEKSWHQYTAHRGCPGDLRRSVGTLV